MISAPEYSFTPFLVPKLSSWFVQVLWFKSLNFSFSDYVPMVLTGYKFSPLTIISITLTVRWCLEGWNDLENPIKSIQPKTFKMTHSTQKKTPRMSNITSHLTSSYLVKHPSSTPWNSNHLLENWSGGDCGFKLRI